MEKIYSQQKQDWELTVAQIMSSFFAKFRLELKKVGQTTGPFRYDLSQIPYHYTVKYRFKGLDLIDKVPDDQWMEVHDIVQETGTKTIPIDTKCKKGKWLPEEDLQIAVEKKEAKSKEEKKRYMYLNAEIQKNSKQR